MTLFGTLFGTKTQNSKNIKILNVQDYKAHISKGNIQLVDVRTPKEHNSGHIKGSLNIDFFQRESFKTQFEKLDKTKPLYLYCRSGNRSQKAANMLLDMGFKIIYDLQGGYMAWN